MISKKILLKFWLNFINNLRRWAHSIEISFKIQTKINHKIYQIMKTLQSPSFLTSLKPHHSSPPAILFPIFLFLDCKDWKNKLFSANFSPFLTCNVYFSKWEACLAHKSSTTLLIYWPLGYNRYLAIELGIFYIK